jgi:formyltetrahydrofolate synthetase
VATVKALKSHGGDVTGGLEALERGAENLAANLRIVRELGFHAVVAINRFPGDTPLELEAAQRLALEGGAFAAEIADGYARGSKGAVELAEAAVEATAMEEEATFLYRSDETIVQKIEAIATRAYGAAEIVLSAEAMAAAERFEALGLGGLPVCMAKTNLSLSHDSSLIGAPTGFVLPVTELRAYTGAGWIVALCGDIMTMPGLPASPAAERIDVTPDGRIVGLH